MSARSSRKRPATILERLAGWLASKALKAGSLRAGTRGDWHEANHFAMALHLLNTGRGHNDDCRLNQALDYRHLTYTFSYNHPTKG